MSRTLLTIFISYLLILTTLAQDIINPQNPYGIYLNYTYSQLPTDSNTYTVSVQVIKLNVEYANGSKPYSYLFKYSSSYDLAMKLVKSGWSYGIYNGNMIALAPPSSSVTQQLELEVTNVSASPNSDQNSSFIIPESITILNSNDVSAQLVGFTLSQNIDYSIYQSPYHNDAATFENISDNPSESSQELEQVTSEDSSSVETTDSSSQPQNSTSEVQFKSSDPIADSMAKFYKAQAIAGNYNYDNTLNPYGIQLVGPFTSLYIYSTIFALGLSSFLYGSFFRASLRASYIRMLSNQ
ncbi:hypothetical protein AYI70_g8713 [Smittium culicis]|uniref:Uncharacterized protein n=1 Tax=Smittium culicis TaxID=133412 RepID=A0A1R1XEN0_9FUNG|nr:hypothetical protein AYI70_g8713 [Smittium culicis]